MEHPSPLHRLGDVGVGAYPIGKLPEVQAWCQEQQHDTGDARYQPIAEMVGSICSEAEGPGCLPMGLIAQLDAILQVKLPAVLETKAPGPATRRAADLAREVNRALREYDWTAPP